MYTYIYIYIYIYCQKIKTMIMAGHIMTITVTGDRICDDCNFGNNPHNLGSKPHKYGDIINETALWKESFCSCDAWHAGLAASSTKKLCWLVVYLLL